ncbi:MAG: hypothetical protein V4519_01680 [Patescibacteria group bacterium]
MPNSVDIIAKKPRSRSPKATMGGVVTKKTIRRVAPVPKRQIHEPVLESLPEVKTKQEQIVSVAAEVKVEFVAEISKTTRKQKPKGFFRRIIENLINSNLQ